MIKAFDLALTALGDYEATFNLDESFDIDELLPPDFELFGAYFIGLLDEPTDDEPFLE
jgi:hypothetical protein